jgi:hypothetical protein
MLWIAVSSDGQLMLSGVRGVSGCTDRGPGAASITTASANPG